MQVNVIGRYERLVVVSSCRTLWSMKSSQHLGQSQETPCWPLEEHSWILETSKKWQLGIWSARFRGKVALVYPSTFCWAYSHILLFLLAILHTKCNNTSFCFLTRPDPSMSSTMVTCKTPPHAIPSKQPVMLIVDSVERRAPVLFTYNQDPIINNIQPSRSFVRLDLTFYSHLYVWPELNCLQCAWPHLQKHRHAVQNVDQNNLNAVTQYQMFKQKPFTVSWK